MFFPRFFHLQRVSAKRPPCLPFVNGEEMKNEEGEKLKINEKICYPHQTPRGFAAKLRNGAFRRFPPCAVLFISERCTISGFSFLRSGKRESERRRLKRWRAGLFHPFLFPIPSIYALFVVTSKISRN